MSKLSLIVAIGALVLAGYIAMETSAREERLEGLEEQLGLMQASVADLDAQIERALKALGEGEAVLLDAEGATAAADAPSGSTKVGLSARRPATAGERLAALEKTVAAQKNTIAKLEEKAESSTASSRAGRFLPGGSFLHTMDAAERELKLSERQKADMQDTIDRAKRELADLYELENDDGETWNAARKGKMTTLGSSGIQVSMPDFKKLAAFKKSRVPGTSETFGEAQKRIKDRAFEDMRRGLTPEQEKKWDGAHKDALLGGGGSDGAVMVTSFEMGSSDEK